MKKTFNTAHSRHDIYARTTQSIIDALEQGVKPWTQPWSAGNMDGRITKPLRFNGKPYSGVNVLMLWMSAQAQGFTTPAWMTLKQANELGGHIRKGEHGTPVVYASTFHKIEHMETGEDLERDIPFLKTYTVFNVTQIDGLPEMYYDKPPPRSNPIDRIDHAEEFFGHAGADLRTGGNRAYYAVHDDYIRMPPIEAFRDAESYYATALHELTHWTRHPARLDRDLGRKRWGDEGYAYEEIVAELGASFLCADLDLRPEDREENAAYIQSWLKALKDDKKFIFHAAAHAQRAADFLHRLQPPPEIDPAFVNKLKRDIDTEAEQTAERDAEPIPVPQPRLQF